jgi:hypothetical protein
MASLSEGKEKGFIMITPRVNVIEFFSLSLTKRLSKLERLSLAWLKFVSKPIIVYPSGASL